MPHSRHDGKSPIWVITSRVILALTEQFLIERPTFDPATGMARFGYSEVEIRPVYEMSDFAEIMTPEAEDVHGRVAAKIEDR